MQRILLAFVVLVALYASTQATISDPCCNFLGQCNYRPGTRTCEISNVAQIQPNADVAAAIPPSGFVENDNNGGCLFNCEWFVRTARRDDASKPCTVQRARNGKFKENCVQEQVCSGCKSALYIPQQPFYLSVNDVVPRCPSFPEDLDAFTAEQLTNARNACQSVAKCSCVSGPIFPQVLSVKE